MPIINKGTSFSNGEQLTADKLNNLVEQASFNASATDGSTTFVNSSGQIAVADSGISAGKLATNAVETAKIKNANVTFAKLADVLDEDDMSSDSATSLATQQSIKAFAGMTPVQNGSGGGYSGGESLTFPNGLTMKFGRVAATENGNYTVNFAENFNTAVISAMAIANVSTNETLSTQIVGTPGVGSMVVGIQNENHLTGFYWQAIGY
jgi:hypothetical protein